MVHHKDSVLIVDDTPANLDVLYTMLSGEGYHVRVANNGENALKSVGTEMPDLILLDIRMPGLDGYEVCKRLKEDDRTQHIPVIFLSAARELEDKMTAFSVGGVDYVTKPFHKEEVLARIKTHLRLKQLTADLEQEVHIRTRELQEEVAERRKASERLRRLSDNLPKGLVYQLNTGKDGVSRKFTYLSGGVRTLYGITPEEGMQDADLLYEQILPEDLIKVKTAEAEAIAGMKTFMVEARFCRADGSQWWSLIVASPYESGSGDIIWDGLQLDITDQKLLEQQFLHAQKMESIGRLASGVAHDFSNMLSIILGAAEMARIDSEKDKDPGKYLDAIIDAAERSTSITRQLLAFSRKEIIAPKPVNFNKLLRDAEKNLRRLIGEDIDIEFCPGSDLWRVLLEPSQLDQIIMNLTVNARDAMPDGGKISIDTRNVFLDEGDSVLMDAKPGEYVRLKVADTGSGMDSTTMEHIFEPFFTTKEVGKGTGLGLATVYGIVTQNHGAITVASGPGNGTVFELYFPRLEKDNIEEEAAQASIGRGRGTIVIVEDEPLLLLMATEMLKSIGYHTIACETPAAAIAEFKQADSKADLLLTDVVMPGMNGVQMAEEIKKVRSDLKVLFMSGYTGDIIEKYGLMEEGVWFIRKPFKLQELAEKIRALLESGA